MAQNVSAQIAVQNMNEQLPWAFHNEASSLCMTGAQAALTRITKQVPPAHRDSQKSITMNLGGRTFSIEPRMT